MFPILGTNMSHYTSSSAGYPGSSAYTVPEQPPFTNGLTRHHSQWRSSSSGASPSLHCPSSPPSPQSPSTTSRKSSFFSLRNTTSRSSTSSTSTSRDSLLNAPTWSDGNNKNFSRHNSNATDSSSSSSSSFTNSVKNKFHRSSTADERAAKKLDKQRRKQVDKAEKDAFRRAQDMEATAMYMAWSMF